MADTAPHELVIIRRRGPSDADMVKGGVWKIAFADFMTAMMAFFLVLWLINASNKETRSAVASYFNPVRLVDSSPTRKGLRDGQDGDGGGANDKTKDKGTEAPKGRPITPPGDKKPVFNDSALFEDPDAMLTEIVAEAARKEAFQPPKADSPQELVKESRLVGGEVYRDPFEAIAPTTGYPTLPKAAPPGPKLAVPREVRSPTEPPNAARGAPPLEAAAAPADPNAPPAAVPAAAGQPAPAQPAQAGAPTQPAGPPAPPTAGPPALPPQPTAAGQPPVSAQPPGPKAAPAPANGKPGPQKETVTPQEAAAVEAAKLLGDISRAIGPDAASPNAPKLSVERTGEGILISLTDQFEFGMFGIGSAKPAAKLIVMMEKIAGILKTRPGTIVIRGHTDARPFKSADYDNWRLSAARAHMAHYMLMRGGLDEKRIERIEGYAAARLKDAKDPFAAENRRIELLLRDTRT